MTMEMSTPAAQPERLPGRLVGREAETAEFGRLAAAAVAGTGQVAFLGGAAGLGKTAVLEYAVLTAERLGMRALYGAAQEADQQRPFAAIAACLGMDPASGEASRTRAAESLRAADRSGLPGVRRGTAEADSATVEALLGRVGALCAQRPLALFIDDLQWADPASLLVVHRLMRSAHRLPLLVTVAYRPVPGGEADRFSRSLALGSRTVLELAPLTPPAVSALLAGLCGAEPGPRLRRMAQGAAGSPLYLTELAAALLREEAVDIRGGIAEVAAGCPVPPLTALITHRLRSLRDEVRQAVQVAAVLGAGCTVADLAAVLDRPTHELLGIVAEAEAAGVLRDAGDRLLFRHDLVRHALYDAVPGSARAMLHVRTAQALVAGGAAAERVAEHLLAAAPMAGEALTTWLDGSVAQLTARAPAMALQLIDQALALADPDEPRHDRLQLHRALAQLSCGHLAEAEETARCALARTRAPEGEHALRWTIAHAAFARGRPDLALIEVRAAGGSADLPVVEATRFRAFGALCLLALGELGEARAVAAAGRCAAEAAGDGLALAIALHVLAAERFLAAPGSEALELARQATRLIPETAQSAQRIWLQLALANNYASLDRGHDAQRTLAAVRTATERTGGIFLPWYHLSCAILAFNTGRWDDALTDIEAGLGLGEQFAMGRALRALATLIAVHRGQEPATAAHLTTNAAASDGGTLAWLCEFLPLCADALVDEAQGDAERAYTRLATAFDHGIGHRSGRLILCFLTPDLVRLALAHDDVANARRYAHAARQRTEHSGAPYHLGDDFRCQGLLERDPDLLLEAARCYREAPRPLSEAHAYTDAAELLAHCGQPAQARALLDRALEIFTRLDARWDAARAHSRLRGIAAGRGARRPRSSARYGWEALTETERLVAGHVADGHSNPEIAARMNISRRTVSTHVSNIFNKLELSSRVALAAEVIRRQDPEQPKQPC
ncbi:AAA family ATPase [Streptomyces sp. NPDC048637]|uniref:ATP-binding protein n=1 Tax=Streptomyces sp. NPDC048637 TaxID=3155636 RepID=UPI00341CE407